MNSKSYQSVITAVENRNQPLFQKTVRNYNRVFKNRAISLAHLLEQIEWCRKVGDLKRAEKILKKSETRFKNEVAYKVQRLRLKNWVKISNQNLIRAQELATEIEFKKPENATLLISQLASMFLSCGKHQEAEALLNKHLPSTQSIYEWGHARLTFCDILICQKKYPEAEIELIETIQRLNQETEKQTVGLERALLVALAETQIKNSKLNDAFKTFSELEKKIPSNTQCTDCALFHKWYGHAFGLNGNLEKANEHFNKSIQIFIDLNIRPESWLSVLCLKSKTTPLTSEEAEILRSYPDISKEFKKSYQLSDDFILSSSSKFDDHEIIINLQTDEYRIKNQWHLSIPMDLLFLALIRCTGSYGIPIQAASAYLFPELSEHSRQPYNRMTQFILRIKKRYQITIKITKGRFRIVKGSEKIAVFNETQKRNNRAILETYHFFRTQEFSSFYGISASHSTKFLKLWVKKKIIKKLNQGKNTSYAKAENNDF